MCAATLQASSDLVHLLDLLPVAAYTCDRDGLITYYNRLAAEMWGREPRLNDPEDRFCGSFKLYTTEGRPIPHSQCWMALALEQNRDYIAQEILVERPDGGRMAVLAHARALRNGNAELIGAVNLITVVGPHREADALRAHLASIVQCSDDAMISKSLDGRIESWNGGAERLFGYTAEEAIGKHITLIVPPERQEEERRILEKLARGERIDHLETVRVAKNGQRLFVSLTTSPLRDGSGRVTGASKVARDITARKLSEVALASLAEQRAGQLADMARLQDLGSRLWTAQELKPILEETLRAVVTIEGTDLGLILMWDQDAAQLVLGASMGLGPEFLKALETVPFGAGPWGRCHAEGRRVVVEDIEQDPTLEPYRAAAREAEVRAIHCTPFLTRAGEVVGVLATHFRRTHRPPRREMDLIDLCTNQAVDFIENAQLQSRLREADERKNQFLAILGHELRNPLAPLRNALELIRRHPTDVSMLERTHAMMERQILHMVRLIDDLIDVSRVTRGRFNLKKEMTTLASVLEAAIESCRPAIEAAGHRLTTAWPSEAVMLDADPTRLAQVFSNVIGNAAKYTPDGGHIWLETERKGKDRIVVRVRDDGLGIPRAALAGIFEIFTQVGDAFERSQGGLGIGLSLARGLVELHGGKITARSDGPGQGSEFLIELPILTQTSPAPTDDQAPSAETEGPGARILVVDDNEDAASSFGLLVSRRGHETRIARDGVEALQVASEFRPEIVFLDIGLPKLSGYEVARAIRGQSWGRSVFLIALTGWGQEDDKRLAFESGFDLHLVKPIDPASVGELIRSYRRKIG